jgi:NAD(P)-dependent dehydrogenase (short-subunit alcohol dehydrogenase family)
MEQFSGRVAVITGAASGIGLALAERAAREGMSVVLSDIEAGPLEAAVEQVRGLGAKAIGHRVDVSKEADVEGLAERAYGEFGAVHLLCNNAGVLNRERATWQHSVADWQWVLNVNLWGVIHGIRAFVPRMLAGGEEGHIVNTASMAGLITGGPGTAVYDASKHAVRSLSESLYRDLVVRQTKVSASVLCPGAVDTKIFEAERNRPSELAPAEGAVPESRVATGGMGQFPPEEMANQVFDAVRADRFYVLASQPVIFEWTKMGHDRMWAGKNPAVAHRLLAQRDAGHPIE